MQGKMIQLTYLLGISLLLTSIIYFFAANWPIFERLTKISLVLLLLIAFYALHLALEKWITWQPFLSNWALLAASIVFGIAVALIGQVYNSHADSYTLFLVWLIPVFLLALITRYAPFYVLSYMLSQFTMYLFILPTNWLTEWSDDVVLLLLLGVLTFNALLFILCYLRILHSTTLMYLTYIMFHMTAFYIAATDEFMFHILWNIVYFLLLAGSIYYWAKPVFHKGLLTITSIFASGFLLFRVFYWVLLYANELILYLLLALAAGITVIGAIITGFLYRSKMNRYLASVLTVTVTVVATLFAMVAISGIFFILFPNATINSLYVMSLLGLVAPALFINMPEQYRYSMLGTGFLLAFITGIIVNQLFYLIALLLPLGFGIYVIKQKGVKVMTFLLTNLVLGYILQDLLNFHLMELILFLLNAAYYLLIIREKATNFAAFLIAAFSFFGMTFVDIGTGLQIVYNLVFLFGVPLLMFILGKNKEKAAWITMLVLWFLFLGLKYYEYLWTLIHKSIAALMLGLIFLAAAYLFDRPNKKSAPAGTVLTYRKSLLIVVIILQLGFVGFQAFTSEKLLQEGTEIKLELEPLDPRSILQGDYLDLHYTISQLDDEIPVGNVTIVLRKENETYHYAGYYQTGNGWNKEYKPKPGDVQINGKATGNGFVRYGIENFFVPEGTGRELEDKVKYAYVRVGKSGNAILNHLE